MWFRRPAARSAPRPPGSARAPPRPASPPGRSDQPVRTPTGGGTISTGVPRPAAADAEYRRRPRRSPPTDRRASRRSRLPPPVRIRPTRPGPDPPRDPSLRRPRSMSVRRDRRTGIGPRRRGRRTPPAETAAPRSGRRAARARAAVSPPRRQPKQVHQSRVVPLARLTRPPCEIVEGFVIAAIRSLKRELTALLPLAARGGTRGLRRQRDRRSRGNQQQSSRKCRSVRHTTKY